MDEQEKNQAALEAVEQLSRTPRAAWLFIDRRTEEELVAAVRRRYGEAYRATFEGKPIC